MINIYFTYPFEAIDCAFPADLVLFTYITIRGNGDRLLTAQLSKTKVYGGG